MGAFFSLIVPCLFLMSTVASADPVLDVVIGGQTRQFGRDELLQRSDVSEVIVTSDVSYGKAMSYHAVPLAALLAGLTVPGDTRALSRLRSTDLSHNSRSISSPTRTLPRRSLG